MSQMDSGCDFDTEAQTVSSQVPPDNKTRIVRHLSCHLKLEIHSTHTFIEGGDSVAAGKSQSLTRVSSFTTTASAVVDSSKAVERARMSEMECGCETDLEAQSAPLLTTPDKMQSARQRMTKFIRVVQSIHRFKALGNVSFDSSPSHARVRSERTAASAVMGSSTVKETDPEIAEASVTTTISGVGFTSAVLQSGSGYTGIELQAHQRANISKIVNEKNLKDLNMIGGIKGVADALNTDLVQGINPGECDQHDDHAIQTTFKKQPVPREYFHFIWEACNNVTTYLLSAAAVLSLGFGIKEEGPNDGWSDGVIIILTIIVLVVFQARHRYCLEKARQKSENQEVRKDKEMEIHVVRGGREEFITGLVCGDIALLKKGYQVPADGLFIEGQNLEVDDGPKFVSNENPFLFHGVRVVNGDARMIVTAVGMETKWSKMMSEEAACTMGEKLYLEAHLDKVTTCINITGLLITIIMFVVSFLRLVSGKLDSENGYKIDSKGEPTAITIILNTFEKILIQPKGSARGLTTLLSMSLVGIVDGIPFVISIAIMYWNQKTLTGNVMVQDSRTCLRLASATTICTDTVGGLTKHELAVHEIYVGKEVMRKSSMISPEVLNKLCEGIGTFEIIPESNFGCMMKEPLLSWARKRFGNRSNSTNLIKYQGQNPEVERCSTIIQVDGAQRRLHWKGPVIDIIKMCSHYYDSKGGKHSIDDERKLFENANLYMREKQMKTIAFACRSTGLPELEETEETNLTLIGLVGLKTTIREEIRKAIETCRSGGVRTILVSSDDVSELTTIALQCGFHTPNSDGMLTGEDFRNFTPPERMEKLEKIQVLGNCDAADKQLLVKCLREKDEVVAVIAQRSADAPALREANIGLTTAIWSSTDTRDMSDITVWGFHFISAVQIIKCGRCIHGNIQKFIQLELITNSACILINFIGVASLGDTSITPIQFFGLNFLVTFLGGLAILTEPPTNTLMNMPPVSPTKGLVTTTMLRNIVTQTVYQVTVLVILQHCGPAILGISPAVKNSIIFNSVSLCQFFNLFIARELKEKNFFTGICRNHWFWIALCSFMGFQAIFVKINHILMNGASLNWKQWTACILIGIGSWLIDYAGKCGSVFISTDCLKGCMTNLAGKYKSFLIIGSQRDIKSMRKINTAPAECGSNLSHPPVSRNPTTISLEIETEPSNEQ